MLQNFFHHGMWFLEKTPIHYAAKNCSRVEAFINVFSIKCKYKLLGSMPTIYIKCKVVENPEYISASFKVFCQTINEVLRTEGDLFRNTVKVILECFFQIGV